MASSSQAMEDMERSYGNIELEDEESFGIEIDDDVEETTLVDDRWCLVGRFLNARSLDFEAMKHTLAGLWKPGKGLFVKELGPNLEYLRVRVTVNIDIPLKRRMKLKKTGGEWFYANLKYEFVPTFCFICGIIGHSENFCHKLFDTPEEELVKPYGNFMRAPPRRKNYLLGAQYLRMGTEADEQFDYERPSVRQPEDMPQMQSHHSNLPRLDFGENHGSKNGNKIPDVVDERNISDIGNKANNGNQTISGNKDSVSKFSANERGKSVVFGDHVPGQHSLFLPGPLMTRGGQGGRGPSLETKRRRQSEGVEKDVGIWK
ncbi:hypothetical protein F8388_015193 [Cannabis sativa]|uniref:Zinc knuckle CX2CX4HX4C domain-containing protein n=1 Tax=Cannabis sativa TaxID=3483 RepID=A0A7J6HLM9_CANSA|nr:hypothetical protein F8388_015193 [Cannabis sativa]KAF4395440.1 hypothetical protein G4B88_010904 [Cannabis sativa]